MPGRVGDSPVPGAGAYGDSEVGGCGATGDGDQVRRHSLVRAIHLVRIALADARPPPIATQMMRLLPSYLGVELMRAGSNPTAAAAAAVARIAKYYPTFWGGVVCVNTAGDHGGAANVGTPFTYTVVSAATGGEPRTVAVSTLDTRSNVLSS